MSPQRRWLRWLARGLLLAAAVSILVVAAALAVLGTGWGRARVLDVVLAQVNQTIPGQLEIGALERLGLGGVVVRDVQLRDPAASPVLGLGSLSVALEPLELIHGRIVLSRVALERARVDLTSIDVPGRGILGALVDPDAPAAPAEPGPPPYVRIDSIEIVDLGLRAPELAAPWRGVEVKGLSATARFELDGVPLVSLLSLTCEVEREARPLARLERLQATLARPGRPSALSLGLAAGAARASVTASGVLPPAPEHATAPIAAEVQLHGLTAADLAEWLQDASLREAFAGSIGLDLIASGTLDQLSVRTRVATAAGEVELKGSLIERLRLELGADAAGLTLARLRSELPSEALSLSLQAMLDRSDPERLPLVLRVAPGRLGAFALPSLDARGVYDGQHVRDLSLDVRHGQSRIAVRGSAAVAGSLDLHVDAAVAAAELGELAKAAGLRAAPRAAIGADLRVQRSLAGELVLRGEAGAEGVRLPDLALDFARVELDLAGQPLALEGSAGVRLRGLTRGGLRVQRADLALSAAGGRYRLRGGAGVDRSRLELDVRAQAESDHWLLEGSAGGRWEQVPFALRLGRTQISPEGWLETRGIDVVAGEQAVHVKGGVGRPRSALVLRAPGLELGPLARLAGLGDDWRGRMALELNQRGRLEAPALELALDARDVARGDAPPLSLRLGAQLDAEQGRASLDLAMGSGAASAWIDGALAFAAEFRGGAGWERRLEAAQHRASLTLRQLELSSLEPWLGRKLPVSARIAAAASLAGTLRQPAVDARVEAALAAALGLPPLTIEQSVSYAGGQLAASLDVADPGGPWLDLDAELGLAPAAASDLLALPAHVATLGDTARWSVRFDARRRRLGAQWDAAPAEVAGLELDAHLALAHEPGAEPEGKASVHVSEARLPTSPAGCSEAGAELALDATLANRKLAAALTVTHQRTQLLAATAAAAVQLSPALRGGALSLGKVTSELTSRGLDLERVPYLCGRVRGRLDAHAALVDPLGAAPSLDARVVATGLSLGAEPSLGFELTARGDAAQADAAVKIRGPRGVSSLSARVPVQWSSGRFALAADAPLSARARLVALPIAPLLDPAGAVSYASGWLSGSVDVGGTVGAPEPSGTLELRDAALTATALAQPLSDVRGRLAFDQRALVIEHFEARDREGKVTLSGRLDRREAQAFDAKLDVTAERFPLRQRGQIVATTSAHAKIQASIEPERTRVTVKLVDADTWLERVVARTGIELTAHPDFVIAGDAPSAAGGAASASDGSSAPSADVEHESHVRLDASDRFWIKRDDFAVQLSTTLDAVIAGDDAKVTGKVDINRGYLDMFGRVFEVERGSRLEFIGASTPDPVVDIVARHAHRGSGRTVKIQISGRGSKPVLTFFIDDGEVSAGEVLELLLGRRSSGGEELGKDDATSFVSALTAGLLATSARRELGAAAPIIMIEPGEQTGDGRIRAGFELDALVPRALRQLITGVYVEGIVAREGSNSSQGQSQQPTTQAGVLLELYFPYQLFTTGQWGPGTTWSIDWGWQL